MICACCLQSGGNQAVVLHVSDGAVYARLSIWRCDSNAPRHGDVFDRALASLEWLNVVLQLLLVLWVGDGVGRSVWRSRFDCERGDVGVDRDWGSFGERCSCMGACLTFAIWRENSAWRLERAAMRLPSAREFKGCYGFEARWRRSL